MSDFFRIHCRRVPDAFKLQGRLTGADIHLAHDLGEALHPACPAALEFHHHCAAENMLRCWR